MNKLLRNIQKQLKFKKRIIKLRLIITETTNYNCYRTTGKPCSCSVCSPNKYSRKIKLKINIII